MAPRGRKKRNDKLPDHIKPQADKLPNYAYFDPRYRGRWVIKIYDPDAKRTKEHPLNLDATANIKDIWTAYDAFFGQNRDSFKYLSDKFQQSLQWRNLAKSTQNDYIKCHDAICTKKTKSGASLGDIPLTSWTTGGIRKYRDARGEVSTSRANHELRYIKRLFSWAIEYEQCGITKNPGTGVKRLKETPRRHYAHDQDYEFALTIAKAGAKKKGKSKGSIPDYVWPFMEIAYLCRLRKSEVLDLTLSDELPKGLQIDRRKGSRGNTTKWNPRLRAAWNAAKHRLKGKPQKLDPTIQHVFIGNDYGRLRESTLDSAWRRLMSTCESKAIEQDTKFARFTPHDLKRKGVTDTPESQKQAGSGHKSEQVMRDHYDVVPPEVDPSAT
jgi:integrase